MSDLKLTLVIQQHDWIPGYAAALLPNSMEEAGHTVSVLINLGKHLDEAAEDLPYALAESCMHEVMHALEARFKQEFDEERIEWLLGLYREWRGSSQGKEWVHFLEDLNHQQYGDPSEIVLDHPDALAALAKSCAESKLPVPDKVTQYYSAVLHAADTIRGYTAGDRTHAEMAAAISTVCCMDAHAEECDLDEDCTCNVPSV